MSKVSKTVLIFMLSFWSFSLSLGADKNCYVFIENSSSYDPQTVSSITLTMIRQFIDSEVQPVPVGGFSDKACIYQVSIVEKPEGLKAFILGKNISDYGTSNLRGEPGLEQAILQAIFKGIGDPSKRKAICRKYGKGLEVECKGIPSAADAMSQSKLKTDLEIASVYENMSLYRHRSPDFSAQYPAIWQIVDPRPNPRAVFMARQPNQKAPAIEIIVSDRQPSRSLNESNIVQFVTDQWKKRIPESNSFKVIKKERIDVTFGTPGLHCILSFYPYKDKSITLLLSYLAINQPGKLIIIQVWGPMGEELSEIAEKIISSVRFD